jgi:hypothetical protein
MIYYLETNSVIKLSKHLTDKCIKDSCFSSLHTICELLTDLKKDTNEFKVKKIALDRLINNIKIDWEHPQIKLFKSFGEECGENLIKEELIRRFNMMLQQSNSRKKFFDKIKTEGLNDE